MSCDCTWCDIYNVYVHVGSNEGMEHSKELFLEGPFDVNVTEHDVRRDKYRKANKRTCKYAVVCLTITKSNSLHLHM